MKKKKTIDLKSLWERSAKSQKIASTTVPIPLTIESEVQISQNVPSNPIQLLLEAPSAHDSDTSPSVQVEKEETNPSTQPDRAASPATGPRTESSPLSPISDDGDDDDDGIYDVDLLPRDPAHRTPISSYDVNKQDAVRRGFVALGPFQPDHEFPQRDIGGKRRFNARWFNEYKWLEYSVELDAAFCFVCYLFKDQTSLSSHGGDAFVNEGFRNWNMKWRFDRHVGSVNSGHNQAQEKYELFISGKQSIRESCASNTEIYKEQYKSRLTYSLKCLRFLLRQGLACRGHDESDDSHNRGNFLELLNWLAQNFEEVNKVVLINAPKNCKMTCPTIQKKIINCCAKATTSLIMQELGDGCFAILADESSDVYQQEQLALCLRYVDKKGRVVERFLGIVQVENTSSLTLKSAIESLLASQSLSFSRVRGQGYDGASNMKGHVNGLKKLIMDECPSAYYVHCFAHQLQLTLVAVAKENSDCVWFFEQLRYLLTVIGNSCKKTHMLRVAQARRIIEALDVGDIETGTGLNQEMG